MPLDKVVEFWKLIFPSVVEDFGSNPAHIVYGTAWHFNYEDLQECSEALREAIEAKKGEDVLESHDRYSSWTIIRGDHLYLDLETVAAVMMRVLKDKKGRRRSFPSSFQRFKSEASKGLTRLH